MNKRTVIVSGGALDEKFAIDILKSEETEFIIGADHGLVFLYEHGILPDYIVGDFDSTPEEIVSYYRERTNIPIRKFNPVKDASDTEIALRFGLELGRKRILLAGATGSRADHLWANVQCLKMALDAGADVRIVDSYNQIRLLDHGVTLKKKEAYGPYFSVFPLSGTVLDFSITGAKYPLSHHVLTPYDSLCVSNEFAEDEVEISFPLGVVVLMETRDVPIYIDDKI
ncbi:MAG: thiamine diphosphokinase [Ruminococcus sp.]|nr:thiamine diphosphokinase [Ruminococcus sp.]